eukprot:scaffold18613_cov65-Attheya_sp.AAC.1
MSSFARAQTQQKCAYLSCALQKALGKYPCANGLGKWADCCEEAITALKYMPSGISPPTMSSYLTTLVDMTECEKMPLPENRC